MLTTTYNQVNARLQALRFRSNQDGEKWKRAVKEHEQMIEALAARDAAAMRDGAAGATCTTSATWCWSSCAPQQRARRQRGSARDERAPAPEGDARSRRQRPTTRVARASNEVAGRLAAAAGRRNAGRGAVLARRPRPLRHRRLDLPGACRSACSCRATPTT